MLLSNKFDTIVKIADLLIDLSDNNADNDQKDKQEDGIPGLEKLAGRPVVECQCPKWEVDLP